MKSFIQKISLILILGLLEVACAHNQESPESRKSLPGTLSLNGVVRLVGGEPFTVLVITTEDGIDYEFNEKDAAQYRNLQMHRVKADAQITSTPLTFANGKPAGTRRVLTVLSKLEDLGPVL